MGDQNSYQFPFAAYPALRLLVLFATGIAIAHLLETVTLQFSLIGTGLVVLFWIAGELIQKRRNLLFGSYIAIICYCLIIFFSGAFWYSLQHHVQRDSEIRANPIQLFEWENIDIKADVIQNGWSQSGREVYEVETKLINLPSDVKWQEQIKMRLYGDEESNNEILPGNRIHAEVRLYSFPEKRNPHEFDYGEWLKSQSIYAHGELIDVHQAERKAKFGWEPIREYVQSNIDEFFDERSAPFAKALFLGYKEELTQDERNAFSRAGLSHIMAVSGLHVGFVVAPFWLIIPWLWASKKRKWAGLFLLTILLFGYAGLTGFSASVSRASLMAWLLTFGKLFHKIRFSINVTALAAIILLLFDPGQLFEIGYQLSFSAVFIILLVMPEAQRIIPEKHRFNWVGSLLTIIVISFIVQLGLFPILTQYFGEFSIVGPAANALVLPLLAITVPVGLMISLIGGLLPFVIQVLSVPVSYSIYWVQHVATYFGELEYGYLAVTHSSIFIYMIWGFSVAVVATIRISAMRWKMVICLLVAINGFMIESTIQKPSTQKLKITMLDVGQGDAVHIKTPAGKNLLVDTGRWTPMGNSGERVLLPYLEYKNIDKLDAVILSHPHADHIGGLPVLMEEVEIEKIYHSDYPYDSRLYETYTSMAEELNIPLHNVGAGEMLEVDPALLFFVTGPRLDRAPDRNPNNHSLTFRLQYGETSYLFTGDAEREQEAELVEMYGDFLNTDFLKVGHHGSRTSSTTEFVETVQPEISAASLAFRNRFGHPGREAVENLYLVRATNYFTSLDGAIQFISDGENIDVIR